MPRWDDRQPLNYFRPLSVEERQPSTAGVEFACVVLSIVTLLVTPGVCLIGQILPWWSVMPVQWAIAAATIACGWAARRGGDKREPPARASDVALAVGTVGLAVPTAVLLLSIMAHAR
ncbi:MAG: hypothetical protein QM770_23585 [Tepidisphaeraceae bacterium]